MKGEYKAYVVGVDDLGLLGIEDVDVFVRMAVLRDSVCKPHVLMDLLKSGRCVDSVVYIASDGDGLGIGDDVGVGGEGGGLVSNVGDNDGLGLVVLDSSCFRGDKSIDTVKYVGVGGVVSYWYVYNYEGLYYYLFRDIVGMVRYFDEGDECYVDCFYNYEAIESYLGELV